MRNAGYLGLDGGVLLYGRHQDDLLGLGRHERHGQRELSTGRGRLERRDVQRAADGPLTERDRGPRHGEHHGHVARLVVPRPPHVGQQAARGPREPRHRHDRGHRPRGRRAGHQVRDVLVPVHPAVPRVLDGRVPVDRLRHQAQRAGRHRYVLRETTQDIRII